MLSSVYFMFMVWTVRQCQCQNKDVIKVSDVIIAYKILWWKRNEKIKAKAGWNHGFSVAGTKCMFYRHKRP